MMKLYYEGTENKMIDINDRSEFYPVVAKAIVEEENGKRLVVKASTDEGSVTYRVGVRSGTQTIFEMDNTMPDTYLTDLKPAYLTCVEPMVMEYLHYLQLHPEDFNENTFYDEVSMRCKNSYKEYKLIPERNKVTAYYGRMAVIKGQLFGERSVDYPLSSYWSKYYEKIGKGYVDRTRLYMPEVFGEVSKPSKKTEKKPETAVKKFSQASQRLFQTLKTLAKNAVTAAQVKVPVTPAIINAAKEDLEMMRKAAIHGDVVSFNLALLDIVSILQRPMATGDGTGVKRILALNKKDFARIIEREENLLQAMEGSITGDYTPKKKEDFSQFSIEVYEATEQQQDEVLKHLSPSLKGKVRSVYRVIPQKQKKLFNAYLKKKSIKDVKMLWHGSRNENWMSIIQNSLLLNPNAIITGKMFGAGIYFAPSSVKSWGYTSYLGTRWANGHSGTAFMGLYAVAYGKPMNVDHWSSFMDYKSEVQQNGYDSLHAHAGVDLHADEIVLYDEAAVLLNYIVEFG